MLKVSSAVIDFGTVPPNIDDGYVWLIGMATVLQRPTPRTGAIGRYSPIRCN